MSRSGWTWHNLWNLLTIIFKYKYFDFRLLENAFVKLPRPSCHDLSSWSVMMTQRCVISKQLEFIFRKSSKILTLSCRRPWSYRNQSIDLQSKSIDWFLYDNGLRYERVNDFNANTILAQLKNRSAMPYFIKSCQQMSRNTPRTSSPISDD